MKVLHVMLVAMSGLLFFARGWLHWKSSPVLQRGWLKRLPHVNDSLLLLSGVAMVLSSSVWSFSSPWLMTKLSLLLVYILLGMIAFKWGRNQIHRLTGWLGAMLVYAFMVTVAVTKQPLGIFAQYAVQ